MGIKVPTWLINLVPTEGATVYAPCGIEIKRTPSVSVNGKENADPLAAQKKVIFISALAIFGAVMWRKFK